MREAMPRTEHPHTSADTASTDTDTARTDSKRREQILRAAAELFESSGYAAALLKDVADASGILPGSLYHHFDSKESIAVELLESYHRDLAEIAELAPVPLEITSKDVAAERITEFATRIATCALAHRAALQLSIYEPHAGASAHLVRLAKQRPRLIDDAMLALLIAAREVGWFCAEVELADLSEQLCETMLHCGLSVLHRETSAERVAPVLCRLLFEGLASEPPGDTALDESAAMRAARKTIDTWSQQDGDEQRGDSAKSTLVKSVARAEFARRGYEATTMRDIASAAQLGAGSVYRAVPSKKALLDSIMGTFYAELSRAYRAVLATDSTPITKLDALTWINLSALDRFNEEFEIQRAWFRTSPPDSDLFTVLRERARQVRTLVEDGQRTGDIRVDGVPISRLSACVRDLIWMPPSLVARVGKQAALTHARATLLRGAAV
ncbi:TetR/AcrR family transcriptional regulator [Nocardia callitridis]|uniref:HTH tetR-type domain-containing protein n=1 Tax=Nocardia callitridis TaxID=648753 RepID=A0ABP9KND4_9NOCA